MFKIASAKHQIVFLAIAVLNILCSELGVQDETDVDDISTKQPAPDGCTYNCFLPYSPLCGSNGKTYGNICHLNTFNRCHKTNIRKIHDGTCQRCVPDPHLITCVCVRRFPLPPIVRCFFTSPPHRPVTCSTIPNRVCGTDGETYLNACRLVFDTACFGYPVRVCQKGPCRSFDDEDSEKVSVADKSAE